MNLILAQSEWVPMLCAIGLLGLFFFFYALCLPHTQCSHDWSVWKDKEGHDFVQERECKKCGEKESRRYDPDISWG